MGLLNDATEVLYPFELNSIPEKFVLKAENELMETPENKMASLKELRELVIGEKDICCRTTDEFFLQFLRARKFNVTKSFSLLKKFVNFKSKNMRFFTGQNYDVMVKLVKKKCLGFLPSRCSDGCAVIVIHLDNWNPSEVPIDEFCRALALFLYHSVRDPVTQINGYKVLLDAKSHPLKHLRFCTPQYIYLLYTGTQECFPGRFKGIHVINISLTFKAAWTIVQPFLSEKLKNRIIFHQNNDTLADYFPKSILPIDFGGTLEEYDTTPWLKNAFQEENLEKLAN